MSLANPANANTDDVKSTDRTAQGPQPDQTPVAPTPGTGGSGVNKIIAGTNITISPGAGVGNVTINAAASGGTVTSVATSGRGILTSPNPIIATGTINGFDPDYFNVADYGAVVNVVADWSPLINACVSAAVAYASTNGAATVFFPQGVWYISAEIVATMATTGHLTIRGSGRSGSIIVQQTAAANGIHADFSAGSTNIKNRAEVCELGFRVTTGVSAGTAVFMDYGQTPGSSVSTPQVQGSTVHDVDIAGTDDDDGPGGLWNGSWTNGIYMLNSWASSVHDCYIYGGDGWTTATPGDGASGGGSGAAVTIQGATNILISHIYSQTWSQAFRIIPVDGLGGSGLVPQGVLISHVDTVTCMEFLHAYANSGGDGIDWLTLTNWQVDNGNSSQANHRTIFLEGGGNVAISDGYSLTLGGIDHIKHNGCSNAYYTSVVMGGAVSGNGVYLTGASNVVLFNGCEFNSLAITLDASAGFCQFNNTGASVITDAGASNRFLATLF